MKPGISLLVADNVIMPGAPEYLDWVRAAPQWRRDLSRKLDIGSFAPDANLEYETVVAKFNADSGQASLNP